MLTIKKQFKTYGKRRIRVYDGKKLFGTIGQAWNWIYIDPVDRGEGIESETFNKNHAILRKIAMENLWWLCHHDRKDDYYTEQEMWESAIEHWDRGIVAYHSGNNSVFHEGEKEIALNSINNR